MITTTQLFILMASPVLVMILLVGIVAWNAKPKKRYIKIPRKLFDDLDFSVEFPIPKVRTSATEIHRKLKVKSVSDETGILTDEVLLNAVKQIEKQEYRYEDFVDGWMDAWKYSLEAIFGKKYIPCKYCLRYDSSVLHLDSDGLAGHYHPHCHAKIIREAILELSKRMS